jgi:WD40 repeat protein
VTSGPATGDYFGPANMLVIGDETGLLKLVKGSFLPLSFGDQNRSLGIKALCRSTLNETFAVLRINGAVEHWGLSFKDIAVPNIILLHTSPNCLTHPFALKAVYKSSEELPVATMSVGTDGQVVISSARDVSEGPADMLSSSFVVSGPVSGCSVAGQSPRALFGGKENDAQVYDLSTQTVLWKAKNVPNDKFSLQVPIWITGMEWLPGSESQFMTGTAYKQLRLYDTRTSNKPALSMNIDTEFSLTSVMPLDDNRVFVSDGAGNLFQHELRSAKRLHTLKGCTGAIRSLTLCEQGQALACVGLDRHLRLFDCESGKLRKALYLKNRLNAVLDLGLGSQLSMDEDSSSADNASVAEEANEEDRLSDFVDSDDSEGQDRCEKKRRK